MTASERANYWNQSYSLYQRVLTAAIEAKANGEFPEIGYDILLLSKGLLLNSEVECRHLIESSNNSEVIALYNKWAQQRAALDYVMQTNAGNTDSTSVKKMAQETDQLEQQLMQKSADFGDFTSGLNITHTEVQQALKPGDVAVEFAAVNPPDMLSEDIYCAYILTSTGKAQLKILGTLDDLYSLAPSSKQAFTANVYNEVWAPILSDLSNVKRVYFAPAGILNNLSIENVDGCKKYEFYRLSSTRELAAANQANTLKDAVVYGGLTYNTDASTLEKESKKYPNVQRTAHLSMRESEGGFDELSGTKVEAELIDKTLKQHNVDVQLFTDASGTETSFKAISNSKHNLVHLATHGFYYTAEQAADIGLSFMQATSQRDFSEDDMLKRSGLAFSGANNIVNGVKLPENVDDGILTAYEIARLNLKDLNLVVLSACQTGLGDVTSDGVFGLQRGFKKAGAQSLLMSLWKVDDQATQMLMSQFYTNLTQGKSKRQSLLNAQRYVREYSDASATNEAARHPYSDPQYWAAFILLDATD
jgi:CHAT domain-containing protein